MVQLFFACTRWRDDGPWGDTAVVQHLRVEITVTELGVDTLASLARLMDHCPHCSAATYAMLKRPRI